eukprot:TRINITY_DN1729_c0_g1_i14.p2 TRINITY_DN1729_c0_g1~~TRINITY_DN1729_c0_g1_i14.p2  ORF type:complete len:102 (+),score=40.01 TRINITY_DN1729_c0_g1_i14:93-398(+)
MYDFFFFFLMIRRPPRSTHCISSAASDVYKRQVSTQSTWEMQIEKLSEATIALSYFEKGQLIFQKNERSRISYDRIQRIQDNCWNYYQQQVMSFQTKVITC